MRDPQVVVMCKHCQKPVLIVAFASHLDRCQAAFEASASAPPPPPIILMAPPSIVSVSVSRQVAAPALAPITPPEISPGSLTPAAASSSSSSTTVKLRHAPPATMSLMNSSLPTPPAALPTPALPGPPPAPAPVKAPLSSTRRGTPDAQKPGRAPPTPPKLVKLKKSGSNAAGSRGGSQKTYKPPSDMDEEVSSPTRQRKEITVLEICKDDDRDGARVTIMVEGGPPSPPGSPMTESPGGAPLASRRWTRRNKLTGLSLSFKIRSDDDDRIRLREFYAEQEDEESSTAHLFRQGGEPSEGWAYTSERKRVASAPSFSDVRTSSHGNGKRTAREHEMLPEPKRASVGTNDGTRASDQGKSRSNKK